MANIQKLTEPYFTDNETILGANTLNPIIAKLNEVIGKVNGGVTPTQTVATPSISISGTTATISCATAGATIYYTTNGNTPTTSSTQYSSAITLTEACTIKAIAVKSGMTNSEVASQSYTPASPVVYMTYASPTDADQYVELANGESGLQGLSQLALDNIKTEVEAMLLDTTQKGGLYSTKNMRLGITTLAEDKVLCGVGGPGNSSVEVAASVNHVYQFDQNSKTGVCHADNVELTDTALSTAQASSCWMVFNMASSSGTPTTGYKHKSCWKFKKLKVYNATTNDVVAEIVPATYNGTPCLYDKVTDTPLYPNTGTLAVE